MRVSVVIPTSNGARFLGPCLEALRATRLPPRSELTPVVVDNGSSDATAEVLDRHPEARKLVFPEPMGFSRANNAARAQATGDVVCFLNNDTKVDPGWLERPLEIFARDPRVVAVGAKLLYMHDFVPVRASLPPGARLRASVAMLDAALNDKVRWSRNVRDGWMVDGSTAYVPVPVPGIDRPRSVSPIVQILAVESPAGATLAVGGGAPRPVGRAPSVLPIPRDARTVRLIQNAGNFLNGRFEGGDVGSGEEEQPGRFDREEVVPALCGAALLVRRAALDAVGWFPEYYTMYYEDMDLCFRLRGKGLLVFCPSSVVNHYHTGTSREHSPRFVENVARSSLLFMARYAPPRDVARTIVERLGHVKNELRNGRWADAAGTRGLISAVPALRGPLGARARAVLLGERPRISPGAADRQPYSEAR